MEAWWNDPLSDTGVAKAKEEKHELRVDKAGLLMEAAEAAAFRECQLLLSSFGFLGR
jgi:hypothetical protein